MNVILKDIRIVDKILLSQCIAYPAMSEMFKIVSESLYYIVNRNLFPVHNVITRAVLKLTGLHV